MMYLERLDDLEGFDEVGLLDCFVRGGVTGVDLLLFFRLRSRGAASSQADALWP